MQSNSPFKVYSASAGSGKTFTLVKEYLKILLGSNNPYKFQQVLAVTFTNKAAGEMKERVIENLDAFSKEKPSPMLEVLMSELKVTETVLFERSKIILQAILQNYSAFSIATIDSFTHKLIRTFAYDLQLPFNFDVEMDASSLLNEAVDVVISKIGVQKELTDLLINYSIAKIDDDKAWDISEDLKSFSKVILNENNTNHLEALKNVSMDDFNSLKQTLQAENKSIEKQFVDLGKIGLQLIKDNSIDHGNFSYGDLPKHFIKLTNFRKLKPEDLKFEGRLDASISANKNLYTAKVSVGTKQQIDAIADELIALYLSSKNAYEVNYGKFVLNGLIMNGLIPLAVLNYINVALQDIKQESNVMLNAEFNKIISDTIKNEPAPFIYERLGEKFRYYFIDEMQDTSQLQWQNLIPLIGNAISSEDDLGEVGKLMLVGDAKQSIYRWRGGKAEQFIDLSSSEKLENSNPFFTEKTIASLETNYRSFTEIINFNNLFFSHISKFLANDSFQKLYFEGNQQKFNSNVGGYVQLSFVEKEEGSEENDLLIPKKVLSIIENCDASFDRNDICVLVRTKKHGVIVANYLTENGIEIISSETLLVSNSEKVQFVVDLLNVIQNPTNKEFKVKILYFLYDFFQVQDAKHNFLEQFLNLPQELFFEELKQFNSSFELPEFIQSALYEGVEYCFRSFQLLGASDSNVQFFLDIVFEYQQKREVSIQGFLDFWDSKKDSLSIVAPEAKNAVRIMTIHKSKGLEFPVVIVPYDLNIYNQIDPTVWYPYADNGNFKSILIDYSKKLNYISSEGVALYNQQQEELELDNFNLLYVALTRASEQSYIVTEKKLDTKGDENVGFTSGLFIHYLKENQLWNSDLNEYSFGDSKRVFFAKKEEKATLFQEDCISNSWKSHAISIVTNSSLLWDTEQGKSIVYGNLIHEILSKINTSNDLEEVVNQYVFKGIISKEQKPYVSELLESVVYHPLLVDYFKQNNQVFCEREIVANDGSIMIPDRLV
nr:UvrD-helicase domain-containing protein [Lutibacter sp.]